MKKQIIFLAILSVFASCEPIDDRDALPAELTAEQIEKQVVIDVRSTDTDGNQIVLENKSKFSGQWNHPFGVSNRKNDTIVVLPGSYTVSFIATTDAGLVTVEKNIVVKKITHELIAPYSYLVGKYGEGVTWVYAKDHPSGNFWGMVADYNWEEFWWFPDNTGESFDNEFTFAFDNGFAFTQDGVKGNFSFDSGSMELTLTDPHLHMDHYDQGQGQAVMDAGKFQVKVINENELVLLQKYPSGIGYDWIWRLKRKGYVYPVE